MSVAGYANDVMEGVRALPKLADTAAKFTPKRIAAAAGGSALIGGVSAGAVSGSVQRRKVVAKGHPVGRLNEVRKAKKRSTAHDIGAGAAVGGAGYAAMSPRHYPFIDDLARHAGVDRKSARAGWTAGRAGRGAVIGGVGGLLVNAARQDQKEAASKALSEGQLLALYGGGTAAAAVGGEIGGRKIGASRYKSGRDVRDGFFQGPPVNRGYFRAKRIAEGSSLGDGGAQVRKADRDQNSSPPASITIRKPDPKALASSAHGQTRTGSFAGKTRGVGRHQNRDQNSSPGALRLIARTPKGKFVSHVNDHEHYTVSPTKARGAVHTSGVHIGRKKPELLKKNDDRKGVFTPVDWAGTLSPGQARRGKRLPL